MISLFFICFDDFFYLFKILRSVGLIKTFHALFNLCLYYAAVTHCCQMVCYRSAVSSRQTVVCSVAWPPTSPTPATARRPSCPSAVSPAPERQQNLMVALPELILVLIQVQAPVPTESLSSSPDLRT